MPPGDAAACGNAASDVPEAGLRAPKGANALRLFQERFTPAVNCGKVADLIEQAAKERT